MSRLQPILLLRVLTLIDGRNSEQVRDITGMSRSTLTRYLTSARQMGVEIAWNRDSGAYRLTNPGVFNLERVKHCAWTAAFWGGSPREHDR